MHSSETETLGISSRDETFWIRD